MPKYKPVMQCLENKSTFIAHPTMLHKKTTEKKIVRHNGKMRKASKN